MLPRQMQQNRLAFQTTEQLGRTVAHACVPRGTLLASNEMLTAQGRNQVRFRLWRRGWTQIIT